MTDKEILIALNAYGLNLDNSVVIGSGILQALNLRESGDLDLVVSEDKFKELLGSKEFVVGETHGRTILKRDNLEIGDKWITSSFSEIFDKSVVINDIRYVSPEYLLQIKKSWVLEDGVNARQKDIDDVQLLEKYRKTKS